MPTDDRGSVTVQIEDLKAGDPDAARYLWDRYFPRLLSLARARHRASRCGPEADGEDAALSAFNNLCDGAARGSFPRLEDREDLWQILVKIATNKVADQARRGRRVKRGGQLVIIDEAALGGTAGLDAIAGPEPDPAFVALVAEQSQQLLEALGNDDLRRIALLRLEGLTLNEIARWLGCSRRTVINKLKLIRGRWQVGAAATRTDMQAQWSAPSE